MKKLINASDNLKMSYFKNIGSDFSYYFIINNEYNENTKIVYENNIVKNILLKFNTIISLTDTRE